jgi:hypothetical protein
MLGAEHGILGLLLVPSLLVVLAVPGLRRPSVELVAGVAFLAVWGFFTHNMLDEWYSLIAIALMATGAPQSLKQPAMSRVHRVIGGRLMPAA